MIRNKLTKVGWNRSRNSPLMMPASTLEERCCKPRLPAYMRITARSKPKLKASYVTDEKGVSMQDNGSLIASDVSTFKALMVLIWAILSIGCSNVSTGAQERPIAALFRAASDG